MQPIFYEKEENGVYTVALDGTTDSGVTLNCTVQLGIKNMKEEEIERLINLGLTLGAIDLHIKQFIENRKSDAIKELHNDFNKRVEYENKFGQS